MFRNACTESFRRILTLTILVSALAICAWSADYKVVYSFKFTQGFPSSGLIADSAGNAYGATYEGSPESAGTVYELSPTTGYRLLYHFSFDGPAGYDPQGTLARDSAGNLYGTTVYGGNSNGDCSMECGVVFELTPPASGTGLWTETVLYSFCSQPGCSDGANPQSGVIFDSEGNLYGTASYGGKGAGIVFELSPPSSGVGPWTETVLYNFCSVSGCGDGKWPFGALSFDNAGNLYGTTRAGGLGGGTAFELSPGIGTWVEAVIYNFCRYTNCTDGESPQAGLTFDSSGNLYGTTLGGGNATGRGTVFELTPDGSGGIWTEKILYSFRGPDGESPYAGVVLDRTGNLYGTTYLGGLKGSGCSSGGCGVVFRLIPTGSGPWTENMFRFPDEESGANPMAPVILDPSGNVYGTTTSGGPKGVGDVFKITP